MLLVPHKPLPCKAGQHHGLFKFAPCFRPHMPIATCKAKRPLAAAQGHHVLPCFRLKLADDENPQRGGN